MAKKSLLKKIVVSIFILFVVLLSAGITALYYLKKNVAVELQQVQQAKSNKFIIGIDVSGSIRPDILDDFKECLFFRLKKFDDDILTEYDVNILGKPGCGQKAVFKLFSTKNRDNIQKFNIKKEDCLSSIQISKVKKVNGRVLPLTTPLYYFLDKILNKVSGCRVIIFSDLVNDDGRCLQKHKFPLNAILKFGKNKNGQLIFFYPKPYLPERINTKENIKKFTKAQNNFISRINRLQQNGKLRAFFYKIPEDKTIQKQFIEFNLKNSIPVTRFEVIWERVYKTIEVMVSGARG